MSELFSFELTLIDCALGHEIKTNAHMHSYLRSCVFSKQHATTIVMQSFSKELLQIIFARELHNFDMTMQPYLSLSLIHNCYIKVDGDPFIALI